MTTMAPNPVSAGHESALGAMILAAGCGERMRPLSDLVPKPLLKVAGKALIVRQIDALRAAGIVDIVINASHLAPMLVDALGDGSALGVRLQWSIEPTPLETAGGIATAYPLLRPGIVLIVSGDICTEYDYSGLIARAARMASGAHAPRVHLVMVPNPPYHPRGDFVLANDRVRLDGGGKLTFGNIALYDTALFSELLRGVKLRLLPLFESWIGSGIVTGELYAGQWANVGTPDELALLDAMMLHREEIHSVNRIHRSKDPMNTTIAANPLLDFSGLPRFDRIGPSNVTPAVDALLEAARAAIATVAGGDAPATWDNVVEPLVNPLDRLERAWGAVRHLNAVVSTPELREAYNGNLPRVTAFYTDLAQDQHLFERYRALRESPGFAALDPAKKKLIENEVRDFRLGGAELPDDRKARYKAVQEELSSLSARFDDNVLDATNDWALWVTDENELAGVPHDVAAEARAAAEAENKGGYKLTLRMPCYLPVMQYADSRVLRETMHRAYVTRASDLGTKPEWDNTGVIGQTLALRHEAANLLGYRNFAEVSLVPKMASTATEVLAFLRDLGRRARPFAERDYAELVAFARTELRLDTIEAWDVAYVSEKLKAARYAFSEQEVRQYFPEHKVLAGLFRVVESIYGIRIREAQATTWHPTVRFFKIEDRDGALVGEFYLDNYARQGKQGGAWMDDAINRRRVGNAVQHPVAYITCNLSAPGGGKPATFTHDEVITIFHEFGHGLHQLLTEVDVAGVSGIQGVEWDAVELPSQFMENFCWEWDVVQHMSAHVDSGAPLPRALFDRMLAARNFQSGLATVRQLEFALFDMLLHSADDPNGTDALTSPQAVLETVRQEIAVIPRPPYDRFMQTFGHVFAGGYAAGYYSYKWAEVLSADAYSLFEETGVLSPEAGARFRDEVLSRGGSRPAIESFVAFRGRPPQIDALLRHNGMVTPS